MKNYNKPVISKNEDLFFEPVLAAYSNPYEPTPECFRPSTPDYDSGDSMPSLACGCIVIGGVVKVWNPFCKKHGWF